MQDRGIKQKIMHYDYYFSEKTGDLYMFIIIKNALDEKARFMIVNHKISQPIPYSTIILLSDIYEFETYSEEEEQQQEEEENRRKLKNSYNLLNEIINGYKVLSKSINRGRNKKNEDISFIDFLDYSFHRAINRTPSAWSIYDDDLIVRYHISISDFFKEFKDIRYNRQSKIQYDGLARYKRTIYGSDTKVERYENVLIHRIEINMENYYYFKYKFLIIISEMDVVKTIKLQVYD